MSVSTEVIRSLATPYRFSSVRSHPHARTSLQIHVHGHFEKRGKRELHLLRSRKQTKGLIMGA